MTYREENDAVTLEMTRDDYEQLLIMLGHAIGATLRLGESKTFYYWIAFVNRLNTGNPRFQSYEIPEEYRAS